MTKSLALLKIETKVKTARSTAKMLQGNGRSETARYKKEEGRGRPRNAQKWADRRTEHLCSPRGADLPLSGMHHHHKSHTENSTQNRSKKEKEKNNNTRTRIETMTHPSGIRMPDTSSTGYLGQLVMSIPRIYRCRSDRLLHVHRMKSIFVIIRIPHLP